MDARLILTRKIQVDIGHLIAVKTKEGFERYGKSFFFERCAAARANLIGQAHAAAHALVLVQLEILALRAQIVRCERVYLGDIRHKSDERRADRTTRADQIAVLKRLTHQLLRDHVHHVVAVADDGLELTVQSRLHDLRQRIAVHALCLLAAHGFQLLG